jgi:Uma2 family endonuclease
MASTLAPTIAPDRVATFQIRPGTLAQFLDTLEEGGPRLICYKGSVTLVSPGIPHETRGRGLANLILAVCLELKIKYRALVSSTWLLPKAAKDTAYEADESFYVQSFGITEEGQVPDLAIEIVVSNPATKALACGALLGIPEMWVLDVSRHRLTFYRLVKQGKRKGTYQPTARSRAFPFLIAREVLERLDDPETDDVAFHENCRAWANQVLVPRRRAEEGNV